MQRDQFHEGEVIGGRYRLDDHIGAGGMANVWRATDQTLDRPVAVKFLYARDEAQHERLSKAFVREARIAAAVRHRYVVSILDFGTHGAGVPYMVMELLEGETLGDLLERRGRLSVPVVVDLIAHILEGLVAVHEADIVHRDLKPENVFVQSERTRVFPKLLDFGISRSVDGDGMRPSAMTTQQGQLLGTPQYMSPEQASGEGAVDHRTDLYSVGVIMYEALTGRLPFDSEGVGSLIVAIITGNCPSVHELVPEVGEPLSDFVAKAMAKEPDERFQDAASMHQALIEATERALGVDAARQLSVRPPMSAELAGKPTVGGAKPRGERHVSAGADTLAQHLDDPTPPAVDATARAPARGRAWPAILAALLVGGGVALGVVYLQPGREAAQGAEQRFIVVNSAAGAQVAAAEPAAGPSPAEPAAEPSAEPPPPAAEPGAESAPDEAAGEPEDDDATGSAAPPSRRAGGTRSLAGTFARHKKAIGKCFSAEGGDDPPALSLRISLTRAGSVEKAEVLPANHAGSALGKCVRGVAEAIEFGPQKQALSFRVPLSVRVER